MILESIFVVLLWLLFWSLGVNIITFYKENDEFSFSQIVKKIFYRNNGHKKYIKYIPILNLFQKDKKTWLYWFLEIWIALLFLGLYYALKDQGIAVLGFWMLTSWSLVLMSLYDILYYEIHLPLIIFSSVLLLIALGVWMFDWYALWWWLWLFLLFLFIYIISYFYVKYRYKVDQEWLWMGDLIISPYIWTLLFVWVSSHNSEYLYFYVLFFLILTGAIGIIFFIIQNRVLKKKASFLNNNQMEENTLPLIPAMILATAIMLIFQDWLFESVMNIFDRFVERIFPAI